MPDSEPSKPSLEDWHIARSKLVDAFASLESALGKLLALAKVKSQGETLGQKIEKLRKAKAGPQYSKAHLKKVESLLPDVEALLDVRNAVVHAPLKLAQIDKKIEVAFVNPKCSQPGRRTAILIDYDEFAKLTRETSILAQALLAPVPANPASSPPSPSRDAAGGP
jgi:hypothetical protein